MLSKGDMTGVGASSLLCTGGVSGSHAAFVDLRGFAFAVTGGGLVCARIVSTVLLGVGGSAYVARRGSGGAVAGALCICGVGDTPTSRGRAEGILKVIGSAYATCRGIARAVAGALCGCGSYVGTVLDGTPRGATALAAGTVGSGLVGAGVVGRNACSKSMNRDDSGTPDLKYISGGICFGAYPPRPRGCGVGTPAWSLNDGGNVGLNLHPSVVISSFGCFGAPLMP